MPSSFALIGSRPVTPVLATVVVTLAIFIITTFQMSAAYLLVITSLCRPDLPAPCADKSNKSHASLVQEQYQTWGQSIARNPYHHDQNLHQLNTSTLTENALTKQFASPLSLFGARLSMPGDDKHGARKDGHPPNKSDAADDCFDEPGKYSHSSHPSTQASLSEAMHLSDLTSPPNCVQGNKIEQGDEDEDEIDEQVEDEDGHGAETHGNAEDEADGGNEDGDDFAAVKKAVNLEAIRQKAIECRAKQLAASTSNLQDDVKNPSCKIDPTPMCGSYNLVYVIRWSDGIKWVARIPSIGCEFGLLNAAKMESEYGTMEYIRKNTHLPVPQVFCHSWVPDLAGVPFALLSFVEGKTLYQFWKEDLSTTEEQKLAMLTVVARYMAELSKLRFPKMGSLYFDRFEAGPTVGPAIETIWDEANGCNKAGLACQRGTMKEQLSACVKEAAFGIMRGYGTVPLTEMAIESIPEYMAIDGQYAICLSDFDLQNIMVDDNGKITGFLDWDGVHIGPLASGAVSYPMWITRDWQTGYGWGYDELTARYPEDSPEQLSAYRQHYLNAMTAFQGSDFDPRWTKLSHILARVNHAAECYTGAVDDMCILFECCKIPFRIADYCDSYEIEGVAKEKDDIIREALNSMWDRYREIPNQICKSHRDDSESGGEEAADAEQYDGEDDPEQDEGENAAVGAKQEEEHTPLDNDETSGHEPEGMISL